MKCVPLRHYVKTSAEAGLDKANVSLKQVYRPDKILRFLQ